jgi:hypothetical protein
VDFKRYEFALLSRTQWGRDFWAKKRNKKKHKQACGEIVAEASKYDRIVIFGTDELAQDIGKTLGDKCEFYIDFDADGSRTIQGKPVKKYDELIMLDNLEAYKVIAVPDRNVISKIEKLLQMELTWSDIILGSSWRGFMGGRAFDTFDIMLGYAKSDVLPGYTIFEDKENRGGKYTIVTLGGSTTDPYVANIPSWSELLYRQLKEMGINARVICGGSSSYDSGHEFIKLFRDVLPMKPDMVISYSGVNDTKYFKSRHLCKNYPYTMQHHEEFMEFAMKHGLNRGFFYGAPYHENVRRLTLGVPNNEDESEVWVRNERMMHAICEEFGVRFHAFLQPIRDYGGYIKSGEPEKDSFAEDSEKNTREYREWYDETRSLIKDIDYITDLSGLFSGQKYIYHDFCHVFEGGNKQIETAIFRHIIKDIREAIKS